MRYSISRFKKLPAPLLYMLLVPYHKYSYSLRGEGRVAAPSCKSDSFLTINIPIPSGARGASEHCGKLATTRDHDHHHRPMLLCECVCPAPPRRRNAAGFCKWITEVSSCSEILADVDAAKRLDTEIGHWRRRGQRHDQRIISSIVLAGKVLREFK